MPETKTEQIIDLIARLNGAIASLVLLQALAPEEALPPVAPLLGTLSQLSNALGLAPDAILTRMDELENDFNHNAYRWN